MVSVIVPVYNAEKYLAACVDSLCGQTLHELEIILVDDGSTDGSAALCERYAEKDARVVLVKKPNGGVSSARNAGLRRASGEWVTFVDADDWLDAGILEKALAQAQTNPDTLVFWNAAEVRGEKTTPCEALCVGVHSLSPSGLQAAALFGCGEPFLGTYFRAVWGKLFRADIIKSRGLAFLEKLYIGEDTVFLTAYIENVNGVCAVADSGYYYRQHAASAVQRYKPDLLEQSRLQLAELEDVCAQNSSAPVLQTAFCALQWELFYNLVQNGEKGFQAGKLDKKARDSDARAWYEEMRARPYLCAGELSRARKLTRLQVRLGCGCPFWIHRAAARVYDWLYTKKNL